ncbi:hypothetical protein AKI39_03580 [Bordetella sp. H567]|nr:hypothetical protein AKI39_03580 [Bordetella sp. H567]
MDPVLGQAGLPNISGNDGGKAAAAQRAAEEQAQATRDAANTQAAAVRDASTQQAASLRDQASAAVAAQTAAINQSAQAAQLASQQAAQPQEGAPDIQLNGYGDSSDPRRRYQGGSAPAIGGTSGGVGIRI